MFNDDIINDNLIKVAKMDEENFQKVLDNQMIILNELREVNRKLDLLLR